MDWYLADSSWQCIKLGIYKWRPSLSLLYWLTFKSLKYKNPTRDCRQDWDWGFLSLFSYPTIVMTGHLPSLGLHSLICILESITLPPLEHCQNTESSKACGVWKAVAFLQAIRQDSLFFIRDVLIISDVQKTIVLVWRDEQAIGGAFFCHHGS